MSPCSSVTLSLLLFCAALPGSSGRLSQPTDGYQGLTVGSASSAANPQIDAWHDAEKQRIEASCNDLMRKLWAEKRQKLQDLVDAARKRVEEMRRLLAEAQAKAQGELQELEEAKAVVVKDIHLQPTRDAIAAMEAKIRELERLIAEKKSCIEELRQSEADLEDALRKLAEAKQRLAEAKATADKQRSVVSNEEGDIPPALRDLESAEDDYARAKSRLEAAAGKVAQSKGDLAEHDGSADYHSLAVDSAPVADTHSLSQDRVSASDSAPLSVRASPPKPLKSGAQGHAALAMAALFVVSLLQ